MDLWITLTTLGWAPVQSTRPFYFRGQREWGRGVHVFSAADLDILGVWPYLVVDRPVLMSLVPGGESRWKFHPYPRIGVTQLKLDGEVLYAVNGMAMFRFCGEFARLLGCRDRIPLAVQFGGIVRPFDEGEADMADVKQTSVQIVLGAILAQGNSTASGKDKKAAALKDVTNKLTAAGASRAGEPELQEALGKILDDVFALAAKVEQRVTDALEAARSARR